MNANYLHNIREGILSVEQSGNNFLIDQTVWLLGMWADELPVKAWLIDCPKMSALLPEMRAEPNRFKRMLSLTNYIDRDDGLGLIADSLRKHFQ